MKRASVSADSISPRATRILPLPAAPPPTGSSSPPHAARPRASVNVAASAPNLFMPPPPGDACRTYQICSWYPDAQPSTTDPGRSAAVADLKSRAIYVALRERILSNDIAPGTRLVMREVANRYEASDIPVREALRMLERDGLVETAPYRGARVTTLTAKEVEETYFIRSHLESIATGLAAERITDAELAQLDVLMD